MNDNSIDVAVAKLKAGECVVYPTSTLAGLGCIPTKNGLDALYALKNRDESMPVSLGVYHMNQVKDLVHFNEEVQELLDSFEKGALSLILPAISPSDKRLGGSNIAIRVFSHPTAASLAKQAGPITATSANKSGIEPHSDCTRAAAELGLSSENIIPGKCDSGLGSTFVKVDLNEDCTSVDMVTVMRQGVVPTKDVEAWLMSRTE